MVVLKVTHGNGMHNIIALLFTMMAFPAISGAEKSCMPYRLI